MDLDAIRKSFTPDPDKWAAERSAVVVAAIWGSLVLALILLMLFAVLNRTWMLTASGGLFGASFSLWYMSKPQDADHE